MLIERLCLIICLIMSKIRNKKLTTLQSIIRTTDHSPEAPHEYHSEPKKSSLVPLPIKNSPYTKKFKVRKIIPFLSQANSVEYHPLVSNNSIEHHQFNSSKSIQKSEFNSKEECIGLVRLKNMRMHTEQVVNKHFSKDSFSKLKKVQSPELRSLSLKHCELTIFEKEEVTKVEAYYYLGKRRINSLKDFTSSSSDAKIVVGDSILYRYQIKSALGQGSFGQVFKAYDHKKAEHVALKIIRNEPKFNNQALVQINILQNVLLHDSKFKSNIVQLKHAFFFRGHACLTFELLHINLYEFLREKKFVGLELDLVRRIGIQILQGLQFLKRMNIIHCDLKPENILLKQENKTGIKIIDVGSGCYQEQQIYTYIQSRFYRAPEIILGIPYTCAIDMWSLGCILSELYLGFPIFPGQSETHQILMFTQVLGLPEQCFLSRGNRSHKFFEGNNMKIKPLKASKIRKANSKSVLQMLENCKDESFVELIGKLLKWKPEERLSPEEALVDEWILKGLPQELKGQHLALVGRQANDR